MPATQSTLDISGLVSSGEISTGSSLSAEDDAVQSNILTSLPDDIILGENGAALKKDVDPLVALDFSLVRGAARTTIKEKMQCVLERSTKADVIDLFVLAFHTRWVRGGKGERKLFYDMMSVLAETNRAEVLHVLKWVHEYGCWKDLLVMAESEEKQDLTEAVCKLFAEELQKDWEVFTKQGSRGKMSLAAKYAPRQKGQFSKTMRADKKIARMWLLGADEKTGEEAKTENLSQMYRQRISALCKAIDVAEQKMCSGAWGDIDFKRIPGVCLDRNKRAFLMEGKNKTASQNEDRMRCRDNLLKTAGEEQTKSLNANIFPHELVQQVMNPPKSRTLGRSSMRNELTPAMEIVINAQWKSLLANLCRMIENRKEELAEGAAKVDAVENMQDAKAVCMGNPFEQVMQVCCDVAVDVAVRENAARPVDLGNVICMSDVSGSMSGTPMEVAIAMGIITAMLAAKNQSPFAGKVITFEDEPQLVDLGDDMTFVQMVRKLEQAPWGGSTDFAKACDLLVDTVREKRLTQDQIPNMLVVSDMQSWKKRELRFEIEFNATFAYKPPRYDDDGNEVEQDDQPSWELTADKIKHRFAELGMELYGAPLEPPKIIFWNVRADTVGFPGASDQPGVTMLSGYSPALMKFVMSGELEEESVVLDEHGVATVKREKLTAQQILQKKLHEKGMQVLREDLQRVFGV